MKRTLVGLGLACVTMVGCQTGSPRGVATTNGGNAWSAPLARTNTPIGNPTPAPQSTWPAAPTNPTLGSPTPVNPTLRAPVPAPSEPNRFAPAPPPGPASNVNFAPPPLDPPGPVVPMGQINSLHPTPQAPPPLNGLPAPPPPIPFDR